MMKSRIAAAAAALMVVMSAAASAQDAPTVQATPQYPALAIEMAGGDAGTGACSLELPTPTRAMVRCIGSTSYQEAMLRSVLKVHREGKLFPGVVFSSDYAYAPDVSESIPVAMLLPTGPEVDYSEYLAVSRQAHQATARLDDAQAKTAALVSAMQDLALSKRRVEEQIAELLAKNNIAIASKGDADKQIRELQMQLTVAQAQASDAAAREADAQKVIAALKDIRVQASQRPAPLTVADLPASVMRPTIIPVSAAPVDSPRVARQYAVSHAATESSPFRPVSRPYLPVPSVAPAAETTTRISMPANRLVAKLTFDTKDQFVRIAREDALPPMRLNGTHNSTTSSSGLFVILPAVQISEYTSRGIKVKVGKIGKEQFGVAGPYKSLNDALDTLPGGSLAPVGVMEGKSFISINKLNDRDA